MRETPHDIGELYDAWREAFRRQDVDAIFALLTPDYVLWAPGAAPMGIDALRPRLVAAFGTYEVEPAFELEERLVSGDLAVDCGWDVQIVRSRAGGDVRTQRQRVWVVLRREPGGPWRFARGITQPGPA